MRWLSLLIIALLILWAMAVHGLANEYRVLEGVALRDAVRETVTVGENTLAIARQGMRG